MEINTTYPNSNTMATQVASREQKVGGIEEVSERKRLATPKSETGKTQAAASDTVNLSAESLKLSQTATGRNSDTQIQISNSKQAQEAVGRLISDVQSNPTQTQAAVAGRARAHLGSLLN